MNPLLLPHPAPPPSCSSPILLLAAVPLYADAPAESAEADTEAPQVDCQCEPYDGKRNGGAFNDVYGYSP